ncbi:ATP-binding cassette domain-containing protein [Oceanirhabdus sp. W0125-5]|uniref:ATP-binding cassette domain-containing protein n=1 Tax=Oceanirhabdus sp. W0125-5 TaxID=2999116 RepID=UPI0022F3435A|nr:ABC transporter ATP-binding protein [Oceanirhabdus sp. W0125-5]WBW99140.1 ABC transporter ATP-binding protein [Oceanirhabdus sp. W0125-5]
MNPIIKLENITKSFGSQQVLKNINLNFCKNKIYGLLGRNGAGKTTLLKLLSNHINPTSGNISQNLTSYDSTTSGVFYCSSLNPIMHNFKVDTLLKISCDLYNNWDWNLCNRLIKLFDIPRNKSIKKLSCGLQNALNIVIAFSCNSPVLLFDEVHVNLDAVNRHSFYELLRNEDLIQDKTIIFSTHFIDEVSNLFDSIILIKENKIAYHISMDDYEDNGYIITGHSKSIHPIINQKNILNIKTLGSQGEFAVFDIIANGDLDLITSLGAKISPLPLQDWFIYIHKENIDIRKFKEDTHV